MLPITERIRENGKKIDPRAGRTRKLLTDAFQSLMQEKSFEEITVQDITERATVNRATFYAHFADKYALGDELMREGFTQILENRLAGTADSPQEYLYSLFLAVTDHWQALNGHCRNSFRMFESMVESQVKGLLLENIREWLGAHRPKETRQHLEMIATIISSSIYGAAMQWTQIRKTETAESFAGKAVSVIAAGLSAE